MQIRLGTIVVSNIKIFNFYIRSAKSFFNCINDISYNFKDLILATWKVIQPMEEESETEYLIDENFDYNSSDDSDNEL